MHVHTIKNYVIVRKIRPCPTLNVALTDASSQTWIFDSQLKGLLSGINGIIQQLSEIYYAFEVLQIKAFNTLDEYTASIITLVNTFCQSIPIPVQL